MRRTRGQGEGSIWKRKDGRWEARVALGWENGKRSSKSYFGKTRAEAQEKLQAGLHDKSVGLLIKEKGQTVGQYLTRWLEDSVRPTQRPGTYERYETMIRLRLIPSLGKIRLDKLTPQHVQMMLAGMRSPSAARYARMVLRSALSRAMKWGLVVRNAAALAEPPRSPRKEARYLDPDQAKALFAAAEGHKDEALFVTAIMCGLRRGELLGLRWQDIDLDARRAIHVRNALHRVRVPGGPPSTLQLEDVKTEKSKRTISPLPAQVVTALRAHRLRQTDNFGVPLPTAYVFTSINGGPIDATTLSYHFKRLLAKAGLPHFRIHDLRHSCASILLAAGVPPKVIQEMLGHSQISTTMNIYAHVMPNLKQEAADAMDAMFGGAGS